MNRFFFCVAFSSMSAILLAQRPAPTAADWSNLATLPDFGGVWELSFGAPGQGSRGRGPAAPALTPEYAAKKRAFDANPPEDSEAANCLPPGMPGIMGQPYPMEFLLTPGKVTIVIEAYTQVRHIYTDGRPLPPDPDLTFHGTSVGRWEGDTLVVDTVGFSPLTQLDRGIPHGGKMRIRRTFPPGRSRHDVDRNHDDRPGRAGGAVHVDQDAEATPQLDDRGVRLSGKQQEFRRRER